MVKVRVVPLYKNKGDCSNCKNYWGISLLSVVIKKFTCIALMYLETLTYCIYQSASVASEPASQQQT